MKQQIRLLKLLGIAFAAMLVITGILWFSVPQGHTSPSVPADSATVTDISVATIAGVALRNPSGSVGMMVAPEGITLVDAPQGNYSSEKLKGFVYYFSHLKAQKVIEPNSSLSEYGLDNSESSLSLLLSDGSKMRLYLGKANPVDGTYYLLKEGDSKVYIVEAAAAAMMSQRIDDFRSMELFPLVNDATRSNLTEITIGHGDDSYALKRREDGGTGDFYDLASPVEATLDWQLVEEHILLPLEGLVPDSFVSAGRPLSEFGLDAPEYTVTLVIGGQSYTAGFVQNDNQSYYCADLSGKQVFLISAEKSAFLSNSYTSLLGGSIYTRNVTEIADLAVSGKGLQYHLALSGEAEFLKGDANGKLLDYIAVTTFYQEISQIPIAKELSGEETIAGDPVLTMTVKLRSGGLDVLDFIPISDRQCAVSVNGQAHFTTYLSVTDDILKSFQHVFS